MQDFKIKEMEKSVSLQRSLSVSNIEKHGKNLGSSNKLNIEKSYENINGNQNSKVIKFL